MLAHPLAHAQSYGYVNASLLRTFGQLAEANSDTRVDVLTLDCEGYAGPSRHAEWRARLERSAGMVSFRVELTRS